MTIEEMKKRKTELGYSNQQLAEAAGVPLGTVQKIFSGLTKAPRRVTILALEKVLSDHRGEGKTADPGAAAGMEQQPGFAYSFRDSSMGAFKNGLIGSGACILAETGLVYGTSAEKQEESTGQSEQKEKKQGEYTLEDYYAFPEERRVELIDGVIYDMAAPLTIHQELLVEIFVSLHSFIRKNHGSCKIFPAPFDVQLDMDDRTMVQPDIVVICNREHMNRRGGYGAPDMVIEILSDSTRKKDVLIKLKKYTEAGVREYWMVDPDKQRVVVYSGLPENLIPVIYTFQNQIPVGIWDNRCIVDFQDIYEQIRYLYEADDKE